MSIIELFLYLIFLHLTINCLMSSDDAVYDRINITFENRFTCGMKTDYTYRRVTEKPATSLIFKAIIVLQCCFACRINVIIFCPQKY